MTMKRRQLFKPADFLYRVPIVFGAIVVSIVTLALVPSARVDSEQATAAGVELTNIANALSPHPATAPGQSATLLPDGRWLLIGGTDHPEQLQALDPTLNRLDNLPLQLSKPRSGHTATLMPDGTVLILGGIGADGAVLDSAEQYDPTTSTVTVWGNLGLEPRAYQSATVLADGRVLIVGGIGSDHGALLDAEVYNPTDHEVQVLADALDTPRLQPVAGWMPSGSVLLWSGTDASGRALTTGAVFDPPNETFAAVDAKAAQDFTQSLSSASEPTVAFGQQGAGVSDVSVSDPLVVRFSERMAVSTLNAYTVTLIGPNGTTAFKATPVDNGLLLFVTPAQDLAPASNYTLFISGATNDAGRPLAFTAIGFTTLTLNSTASSRSSSASPASPSADISTGRLLRRQPASTSTTSATPMGDASGGNKGNARTTAQSAKPHSAGAATVAQIATRTAPVTLHTATAPNAPPSDGERWIPTAANYSGRWISGHRSVAQQSMPQNDLLKRALYGNPEIIAVMDKLTPAAVAAGALRNLVPLDRIQGPPGVTAVTGQVLRMNGQPLRDVTLSIGTGSIRTGGNGEFTLNNAPAGHQILVIDGGSATQGNHQYGRFEYGMNVVNGQTNALPFVIWMTALDTQDAVTISSPTSATTVLTNPEIPGLELRIPAGTVIRDAAGKIVTSISMTAIPTDQPPFPLPDFPVPVYFTVQPGGAHLEGSGGQITHGAQLVYPNFTHSPPGARMTFWNYDASGKGWYVYGQGTVTTDGTQVMPDPGVVIYEFSGAMVSLPSNAPAEGPPPGGCKHGDPVDCFTGLFVDDEVDLSIPDVIPIELRRTYRQRDNISRAFGIGANLGFDFFNVGTSNATSSSGYTYTYQDLILPDGAHIHYPRISAGTSFGDAVYQNTSTPGRFYGSIIKWGGIAGYAWSLTLKDGTMFGFPDSDGSGNARAAAVGIIIDRNGNTVTLTRVGYNLTQITSPNGRHLNLTYDSSNRVTQASDDLGRTVGYAYDSLGRLIKVTDPAGNIKQYTYDSSNNMLTVTDKRGHVKVTNTYDANSRVKTQTYADGTTSSFAYTLDGTGTIVTQTQFTDQRGVITQLAFNANGYPTQITRALGHPEQQIFAYGRDPNTNLVNSITDALNRTTSFTYDSLGNVTQETSLAGTANAVALSVQYNSTFSLPTQVTDPNNNTTQLSYDTRGNLLQVTDPLSHVSKFTHNSQGRLLTATDANGNATSLSYFGADVASVADALGDITFIGTDPVGRVVSISNPVGAQIANIYNVLDEPTSTTNPNGAAIQFGYDANGNELTRTDSNSHSTTYSYDSLNRAVTRTDALLSVETYAYEPGGFINQDIDRKGQVRGWTYDALGRATQMGFGATKSSPTAYTSTINQTWDAGDRLTQMVDSVAGTITHTYDGLNRLTHETTPKGSVAYTYDAGGRRTSMTVQGQPTVTYTWDVANRLTQLQQAAGSINGNTPQTITFQYDNANRRTQTVLSNGVKGSYAYDSANHLTGITYTQANGTTIGNLTYTYDAAGHRTAVGGSLANVSIPASAFSGSYDANNRLVQLNSATVTYDSNGSTTNNGTSTYAWDARNQLASVTGSVNATLQYDALGRRVQKAIGATTTGYLYDGINFVQEQNAAGAVTATLVAGGVDELFGRMTSAGISVPLTDALGSVIAETGSAQTVTTSFAYEPYGKTTQTGTSSGNSQQYTGRESDGTGLYYYRARYYSPSTARFLSEDPLGFGGGANIYAYANGNPISFRDPSGLIVYIVGNTPAEYAALQAAFDNVGGTVYGANLINTLETSSTVYTITNEANGDAYFNPNTNTISVDPNFHPMTQTSAGTQPAPTDAILGHEIGHAATGTLDNGPNNMNNVIQNENPIRLQLGEPIRCAY
jgi:RHS repeat-associated protein